MEQLVLPFERNCENCEYILQDISKSILGEKYNADKYSLPTPDEINQYLVFIKGHLHGDTVYLKVYSAVEKCFFTAKFKITPRSVVRVSKWFMVV